MNFSNIDEFSFDSFFDDSGVMQMLLDTVWVDRYQNKWWKKHFEMDSAPTPVALNGSAPYTVIEDVAEGESMLDARATWSQPSQVDTGGFTGRNGNLYDFGRLTTVDLKTREYYNKQMLKFASNEAKFKPLVKYIKGVDALILGGHSLLNYTGAQKMSTGLFSRKENPGDGLPIESVNVLSSDAFYKAGESLWSDPDISLIEVLVNAEAAFREKHSDYKGALSWKMERDVFNLFLKNKEIKADLGTFLSWQSGTNTIAVSQKTVTEGMVSSWLANASGISPIEIQEEREIVQNVEPVTAIVPLRETRKELKGWKTGSVVLSPATKNGVIKYSSVEELGALARSDTRYKASYAEGGLFGILNYTYEPKRGKEWTTELLTSLAPELSDFNHHWIFDTLTAGKNYWE